MNDRCRDRVCGVYCAIIGLVLSNSKPGKLYI